MEETQVMVYVNEESVREGAEPHKPVRENSTRSTLAKQS